MSLMGYIGEQFHKPTGLGGRLATFIMNRQNDRQYRAVEEVLDLRDSDIALDIGFGNGYLLCRLAGSYLTPQAVVEEKAYCIVYRKP